MSHHIRKAIRDRPLGPLGGLGHANEADETFIGRKEGEKVQRGTAHKHVVLGLVEGRLARPMLRS
jgi:hypothetical protein